jgi:hypothetical protein
MAFGLEVINTDGSILIGDTPPLLQVIESGTITLVSNDVNAVIGTGSYPANFYTNNFSLAKMPVSCLGKQWAFSFSGNATTNAPYGLSGVTSLTYGAFAVSCNNNGTIVPGLLFPKSWQGQSISYVILDFPIAATSGYGLEVRNAANTVVLSTGNPLFIYKDAVNDLGYGTNWAREPDAAFPPTNGTVVNKTLTIPSGKTPYILGSNYLRDVFLFHEGNNFYNYYPICLNIMSVSTSNVSFLTRYARRAIYNYYTFQLRDDAGFQHAKIQVGYVV